MTFNKWLDTMVSEKGLNTDQIMEIEGSMGINMMPLSILLDAIKGAPAHEQNGIKAMLVKIDFLNGDVMDYFRHLGKAIAI